MSSQRLFNYQNIRIKVYAGVFHPGLFFSTKILLNYLSSLNLKKKNLLELGAGSGLISIYSSKHGAYATASDISQLAIDNIIENTQLNNVNIRVIKSDLFNEIDPKEYDLIIINPPFYPNNPQKESDHAWFCGVNFEYFHKLFNQLESIIINEGKMIMILSEDCNIQKICSIAVEYKRSLNILKEKRIWGEKFTIYEIR